ncbi:HNH endonuclease [Carboxylicivirga sp. M1479]|uniref:HNH endonuclease n=1 Tax=Carboxylicivirga sp. M1479 TaxID=2594476 RepID=UPI0011785914|nr:HNH endonuclease [Carboxylicivirga sp. M1479]TRX63987.1 HNH endonuclease [Carboxylicivirga sp. M1479]
MTRRNWTRKELIAAFNLYCKMPFGKLHKRNPKIIKLATIINRTPSAVAYKLVNFASFDPVLKLRGIKGMKNAAKADREIFNEFYTNQEELVFESENVIAQLEKQPIEEKYKDKLPILDSFKGNERTSYIKTRVNQHFFREVVLSNYSSSCAITGISIPSLLIASHIKPWAQDENNRLNPGNGICLSALYDKAFDKGLITVDGKYRIVLSSILKEYTTNEYYHTHFGQIENQKIILPEKYLPEMKFLEWHQENIFENHN